MKIAGGHHTTQHRLNPGPGLLSADRAVQRQYPTDEICEGCNIATP